MATVPGSMLFGLSSPYSQRGVLYDAYKTYFGVENEDVLVWQAATWLMNPTIPDQFFEREYERDPASAASEYGAEFRKDSEAFLPEEAYDANVDLGVFERPYVGACAPYFAFVDPSGGSRDSFTLAIAHIDPDSTEEYFVKVLDCIREYRPPFSPDDVVNELGKVLQTYHLKEVTGDRYSGDWVAERFYAHGISYRTCTKAKSDIYKDVLPYLMSNRVVLLDNTRLRAQTLSLERKSGGRGRDIIDHPSNGRDDVANSAYGVLVEAQAVAEVDIW
jgi:hypothetical protein